LAKVGLRNFQISKIGSKTVDVVFIRHAQNSVAYRFILYGFGFGAIKVSRDAEFVEHIFPMRNKCLPIASTSSCIIASSINLD